jgi:hypothetical protein
MLIQIPLIARAAKCLRKIYINKINSIQYTVRKRILSNYLTGVLHVFKCVL